MPTSANSTAASGGAKASAAASQHPSASSSASTHHFHGERHHPVIEVAQHFISPLTASLTIFLMHKAGQLPAFRASLRAAYLRWSATQAQRASAVSHVGLGRHTLHDAHHHHHHHAAAAVHPKATHAHAHAAHVPPARGLHTMARSTVQAGTLLKPAAAVLSGFGAPHGLSSVGKRHYRSDSAAAAAAAAAAPVAGGTGSVVTGSASIAARRALAAAAATAGAAGVAHATGVTPLPGELLQPPAGEVPPIDIDLSALLTPPPDLPSHNLNVLTELYAPEEARAVADHLTNWLSVQWVETGLNWLHDTAGLPWWSTIAVATVALRVALAPVNILLLRNTLRMKVIAPAVDALEKRMTDPEATPEQRLVAAEELRVLFKARECSPWHFTTVFPFLLPPTILSIFGAIYNLSITTPAMATEGIAWFPDLLLPDATNMLPVLSAATWLLNVEAGAGAQYHSSARAQFLVRTSVCLGWALSAPMPAGVLWFWVVSNIFSLVRAYITRLDSVRHALKMPLASEIAALSHIPKSVS